METYISTRRMTHNSLLASVSIHDDSLTNPPCHVRWKEINRGGRIISLKKLRCSLEIRQETTNVNKSIIVYRSDHLDIFCLADCIANEIYND